MVDEDTKKGKGKGEEMKSLVVGEKFSQKKRRFLEFLLQLGDIIW